MTTTNPTALRAKAQNIENVYELSPMQEGMLFETLYAPGTGIYINQMYFTLDGALHVDAFRQAWQQVVDRHAILRTLFVWENRERPLQVVRKTVELPWHTEDWRGEPNRDTRLQAFLAADHKAGFQLEQAPLMRCTLIRTDDTTYTFVWTIHHILIDGWSLPILLQEVWSFYEAALRHRTLQLPKPRPYSEYINWLQRQDRAAAETFWRGVLRDFTAPTPFHVDKGVDVSKEHDGTAPDYTEEIVSIPLPLWERLNAFATAARVTMNTLMQAAWAILLGRYSGTDDIVFGSTVAGRPPALTGVETMVGLFVNTLPVRVQLATATTGIALVQSMQQQQLEREQFEYTPLLDIQKWSDVPAGTPLFESLLVYENYPFDPADQSHATTLIREIEGTERGNYALHLIVAPGQEPFLRVNYDVTRFAQATIERMANHLLMLLENITATPEQSIAQLSMFAFEEAQHLLVDWNVPRDFLMPARKGMTPDFLMPEWQVTEHDSAQCIHQLFEKQVERTPDAIALIFHDEQRINPQSPIPNQLSFRELNERANQLAHHLRTLGVGGSAKDVAIVGLCANRSIELIVGFWAILKAGGAYLPLDPAYPQERLAFMLNDAQPHVLLTQADLLAELPAYSGHTRCLDRDWEIVAQQPTTNLPNRATADQLAYIIYTSGSTGNPKGVLVPHRAIPNLAHTMITIMAIEPASRVLQFSSLSFDASIPEIIMAHCAGASLHLAPKVRLHPGPDLANLLQQAAISHMIVAPSVLAALPDDAYPDLQGIIVAGEAFAPDLVAKWSADRRLFNAYGPSEATVCSTVAKAVLVGNRVPIGGPINGVHVYVLDPSGQPVPIGVPGELYIGGIGVAQGYLNRPELTAETFVKLDDLPLAMVLAHVEAGNPPPPSLPRLWGRNNAARYLYRTGDLVRWLPNGQLEFLGRIDNQVKIRGFRVEVEEIEAILSQDTTLQDCAVVVREVDGSNRQLIAYLVATDPPLPSEQLITNVRQRLATQLPDYMVPSLFIPVETLPLMPSGKVDRKALAAMEITSLATAEAVPPRTATEATMAQLWGDVLGLAQVGIYDDFFEAGGHSLSATQIISRVRATFNIDVPLRTIFESPTIAGFSDEIDEMRQAAQGTISTTIVPVDRSEILPQSHAQERLWFLAQWEEGGATYNMPTALRLHGTLEIPVLEASLQQLVRRHESLRTTFTTIDGQPVQVLNDPTLQLQYIDLTMVPPAEREAEAKARLASEAQHCFDLVAEPLLRVTLLQFAADESILAINMHHIISDGWSMGVFMRELTALYTAFLHDQPSPLAALPIQYADFARWQRQWLQEEAMVEQLQYWQQQLADAPPLLELPTDRPRPPVQRFHGAIYLHTVPKPLSKQITQLSTRSGTTLFMTLLAAFNVLLMSYSRQEDILVGTTIANRNRIELEPLIGFFVNTLVLRNDLSENPTFHELLARVKSSTLDAYRHQDVPFEKVVEALQPQRNLSHTPLFQVMFDLQNAPIALADLPGLTVEPVDFDYPVAKFDLSLSTHEASEGITCLWEYNTDLFDDATVARMAAQFQCLLAGIVADPHQRIANLPLLTLAEQNQILAEWSTSIEYGTIPHLTDKGIHHLFEEHVERTPDNIAIITTLPYIGASIPTNPERVNPTTKIVNRLTYSQLNACANQLAHQLRALGVGHGEETVVGLCLERSPDIIIAILAILKAGGAYVPIEANNPTERIQFILADAQPSVLLTQTTLLPHFTDYEGKTLCLDRDWSQIAGQNTDNLDVTIPPNQLAYVIYTSGSTGDPKGVLTEHSALVTHCTGVQQTHQLQPADRTLLFSTFQFDGSVEQLFPSLIAGATVVLAETTLGVEEFSEIIDRHNVTILDIPPAYWQLVVQHWAESGDLRAISQLRLVMVGGDVLPVDAVATWQQLGLDHITVRNGYGPTEATVTTTAFDIPNPFDATQAQVPIGRPVPGKAVYILDEYQQPVPLGVPGELCIGGVGLARGYHNRPELTQAAFIPNPFRIKDQLDRTLFNGSLSGSPSGAKAERASTGSALDHINSHSSRLYRTGDLARWRPAPDGGLPIIEFLGRTDHQVKIRGFRIELGEIEDVLTKHPDVREAVVVVHTHHTEKRLIAYIATNSQQLEQHFRDYLQQKLPDYMVPSAFILLDALPLNTNGKVDRQALPAPEFTQQQEQVDHPRTPQEQQLRQVWAETLALYPVGIHDNFFALGGHSLLAVRLIARIQQVCGQRLPLAALFQHPTIAELATVLQQTPAIDKWLSIVPIQPNGSKPPFFCVPGAGGTPFYFYPLAMHLGQDQPLYGFQAAGLDGMTTPDRSVAAMAARYVAELRQVQPEGPYTVGGHSLGGWVAFEMAQQLVKQGQEVAMIALFDTVWPGFSNAEEQAMNQVELLLLFLETVSASLEQTHGLTAAMLAPLSPQEQLEHVRRALETLQILPPEIDIAHVRGMVNVFQQNVQMAYLPKSVVLVPVTLFAVKEHHDGSRRYTAEQFVEGWSPYAAVELKTVPGTHETMVMEPAVSVLAQALADALATKVNHSRV